MYGRYTGIAMESASSSAVSRHASSTARVIPRIAGQIPAMMGRTRAVREALLGANITKSTTYLTPPHSLF